MNGTIKIELKDGSPFFELDYDGQEALEELMITLFCPSSHEVFYLAIKDLLAKQDRSQELEWFERFYIIAKEVNAKTKKQANPNRVLMRPSSFK